MSHTITTYGDIEPHEPLWFLPGIAVCGDLTIVAAPGGTGKGLSLDAIAAAVSRGRALPGEPEGTTHEPGTVIMVTPEDDACSAMAYRLRAADADLTRIVDLTIMESGAPFLLPDHVGQLRELVDELTDAGANPRLIVIDPLMAVVDTPISTNRGARRVLQPLRMLAAQTGMAVLVSHHTVKSGAIAGAKGLTDAARSVWRIERLPDNPKIRRWVPDKMNIGSDEAEPLLFTIDGEGTEARCTWLTRGELDRRQNAWRTQRKPAQRPAVRAVHQAAPPTKPPTKSSFYVGWLITGRGPVGSKEIIRADADLGAVLNACTSHPGYGQARAWSNHVREDKSLNRNAMTTDVQNQNGVQTVYMICANQPITNDLLSAARASIEREQWKKSLSHNEKGFR